MMSERQRAAIERAAQLGTLGKIDRSKQYDDAEHRSAAALLRSQNYQWNQIRRLKLWIKILTAAVTALGLLETILKQLLH